MRWERRGIVSIFSSFYLLFLSSFSSSGWGSFELFGAGVHVGAVAYRRHSLS